MLAPGPGRAVRVDAQVVRIDVGQLRGIEGRHGIERYFITREPYDDQQDAVYEITNIEVDSPDPGVATQFSERDDEAKDGREVQKRIRIGDPDETISADTATYVITYDVTGAMRTFSGYDEFFWDAVLAAVVITFVSWVLNVVLPDDDD